MLVHGVSPPQVQDFIFSLVEFHEIPASPLLEPVPVPLNGSETTRCTSHSSQLRIFCKIVTLSRSGMKNPSGPSRTPGDTMSKWPPAGLPAVHHDSSRPVQTVLWIILLFERHYTFSKADDEWVSPFCTLTWQLLSQGNATNYSSVDISIASHQFRSNYKHHTHLWDLCFA